MERVNVYHRRTVVGKVVFQEENARMESGSISTFSPEQERMLLIKWLKYAVMSSRLENVIRLWMHFSMNGSAVCSISLRNLLQLTMQ